MTKQIMCSECNTLPAAIYIPANFTLADTTAYSELFEEDQVLCYPCYTEYKKQTEIAIKRLMESKSFIEQTYDGCIGVLRLAEKYGNERLEAACKRANIGSRINYKTIQNILKNNLDKVLLKENELTLFIPNHENIRGAETYR